MSGARGREPVLLEACMAIAGHADLNGNELAVTTTERNTRIELKRYEAFFRLYLAEDVRCSIRMNTEGEKSRRNDFLLYTPPKGASAEQVSADMESKVGLGKTLEALSRVRSGWDGSKGPGEHEAWLREWLDKWCPAEKPKAEREAKRFSITVDADAYETLRRYAFHKKVTPNRAAAAILETHMELLRRREEEHPDDSR